MIELTDEFAGLIGIIDQKGYFLQLRESIVPDFQKGNYPFVFPGVCSMFGGAIEAGETPEQALKREIEEELPDLALPKLSGTKTYDWSKQAEEVFDKVNEAYHGNLESFLGFTLDSYIPHSALGKFRHQLNTNERVTCREWLCYTGYYFTGNLSYKDVADLRIREGIRSIISPFEIVKTLVMEPGDKLAILDDLVDRASKGEIQLI